MNGVAAGAGPRHPGAMRALLLALGPGCRLDSTLRTEIVVKGGEDSGVEDGGTGGDPGGGTGGNISAEPAYTDDSGSAPQGWDLTPGAGSPLIDAGDPSVSDADGSTSDIGASGGPGAAP